MWIADLSKAWPTLTGAKLKALGARGVIGYTGCLDTAKNVSKARFQDWLSSGLWTALVVEDFATSLRNPGVGDRQGQSVYQSAKALGYDVDNCVLFASADWNSRGTDLIAIENNMEDFSTRVPVPGLYGNSYAIESIFDAGTADYFWQSESTSFSDGISPFANLLQIYNDSRAQGNALDVNNVLKTPLGFMNEPGVITPQEDDMKAYLGIEPIPNNPRYWLIAYDFEFKVRITQAVYNGMKNSGFYQGLPPGGMDEATLVTIPVINPSFNP